MSKASATPKNAAPGAKTATPGLGDDIATVDAVGKKLSPIEQDEIAQQSKVLKLLEQHRETGAYLEVCCREPGKMEWEFLDLMPLESYNVKTFSERFGGGTYRLIAKTDRHTYITTWNVTVNKSIAPVRGAGPAPAAGATSEVAAAMKEFRATLQPLIDRAVQPQAPQDSTLKDLMPMITAAIARPAPESNSMEMFKFLAEQQAKSEARFERLLEKLAEQSKPGRDKFRDALEERLVEQLIDGDTEKPAKEGTFFEKMALALAPTLGPIVQGFVANGGSIPGMPSGPQRQLPQSAPVLRAANGAGGPDPAAAARTVSPSPTTETAPEEMNILLRAKLATMKAAALTAAKRGQDAAEFTLSMLAMAGDESLPQIFGAANAEEWFQNLFSGDVEATKHLEFFTEIRNTILAQSVVFVARANLKQNASPEDTARVIVASLSKSFHEYLFNETDKENWSVLFQGVELPADWLERLRVAIDNALGGEEKPAAPGAAAAPDAKPAAQ